MKKKSKTFARIMLFVFVYVARTASFGQHVFYVKYIKTSLKKKKTLLRCCNS